jgi:glycosyltransferase involved in cell wall biosynthesis
VYPYLPGMPASLLERYSPALHDASVMHFTRSLVWFELQARLRGWHGWERIMRRNAWFQRHAKPALQRQFARETTAPTVFSYSYAASELFSVAQQQGGRTVLGQIDAGPHEEALVAEEHARYPELSQGTVRAPAAYWASWREECRMADTIVVNSSWSRTALQEAGIEGSRVQVIPLMFETANQRNGRPRSYPKQFTHDRPLRVLFLGSLILRKGMGRLLEAIDRLQGVPVHWTFVGDERISVPARYKEIPNISWEGRVARSQTRAYYDAADVFILPTISDGFALTQLEAQAHGLPVITSERCGDVVRDRENGLRLRDVSPEAIAEAIHWCIDHPDHLPGMSAQALTCVEQFHPQRVMPDLIRAVVPPTS